MSEGKRVDGELLAPTGGMRPGPRAAEASPGRRGRAFVKLDLDAEIYRALGPIAARKRLAVTAYVNSIMADIVGRASLGDIVGELAAPALPAPTP
jgi:hypothetical protein